MAAISRIGWTDGTWNPYTWHCQPVSEGCDNCYAMALADRWHGRGSFVAGVPRLKPARLLLPLIDREYLAAGTLFTASMTDPMHAATPIDEQALVWAVMAASRQQHQVLSKRHTVMRARLSSKAFADRVRAALPEVADRITALGRPTPLRRAAMRAVEQAMDQFTWPLPNVWAGMSVESPQWERNRTPELMRTPAAIRFLSVEPLVERVDLTPWLTGEQRLDWVICGGESGPKARPMEEAWVVEIRDACAAAGVPLFFKQAGKVLGVEWGCTNGHGDIPAEWPERLALPQDFPLIEGHPATLAL